jgi:hypothetical protein
MASSGMLRRVALVRTNRSEDLSASFIRVTRIGELGTLAQLATASVAIASARYAVIFFIFLHCTLQRTHFVGLCGSRISNHGVSFGVKCPHLQNF